MTKRKRTLVILALLACWAVKGMFADGQGYKHKSEVAITRMSPAQRVDEYAEEQAHHKFDVSDDNGRLIEKYIWRDGLQSLPRIIQIMKEYDPRQESGKDNHKGERFDAMWMLLADLDSHVVRLRSSESGRQAMKALEDAIDRMRAAGYGRPDQHEWSQHGRFELALMSLNKAKGIGTVDRDVRDTLWVQYNIQVSDQELLDFSNFLISRDPGYPTWSETNFIKDSSRRNDAGYPLQVYVMKKPEPFYNAYLDFHKARQ